jgi:hypothetical protein
LDEGTAPVIWEASISVKAFVLFDMFGNRFDTKPDVIAAVIARREAVPMNAGNLVVLTMLLIVYDSIQARLRCFFSRLEIHKDLLWGRKQTMKKYTMCPWQKRSTSSLLF